MSDSSHGHDDHGFAHVMPVWGLLAVFFALIGLTALTVVTAQMSFGEFDLVIAMMIASVKALLVMAFFMHMIHDKKFNIIVFISSFLFMALFVGFTLMDMNSYHPDVQERTAEIPETVIEQPN